MQSDVPAAMQLLHQLAVARYDGCPLRKLCTLDAALSELDDSLTASLYVDREQLVERLDEALAGLAAVVQQLVGRTVRQLHARNQFLHIDEAAMRELAAMHERFVPALRSALARADSEQQLKTRVQEVLRSHVASLGGVLLRLDEPGRNHGMVFREVKCAQYEPVLQLRVLGLEPETMLDPVLDLGCGESAALVRHLRDLGHEAFGIERVGQVSELLVGTDWLQTPLQPGAWGTVLSHLGFSNHFLHEHLRVGGLAERYAHKYMELLRALKPGGSLVYSPGLPFVETLLSREAYSVMKLPVPRVVGGVCDDEMSSVYGSSVFYACRVTRNR
jgi:hypothetical protein